MQHHDAFLFSKCSQQFQLQTHRRKVLRNEPFSVLAFKIFPSDSTSKTSFQIPLTCTSVLDFVLNSTRRQRLATLISFLLSSVQNIDSDCIITYHYSVLLSKCSQQLQLPKYRFIMRQKAPLNVLVFKI